MEDIIEQFNSFLKIKNQKKISISAQRRLDFLKTEIIDNRYLTVKTYQFCTTKLGKKYNCHHSTVGKWLKTLVKLGYLRITNGKWHKGDFSKTYKLTEMGLDLVNKFNGYAKKFAKGLKKKADRRKKLKNFDALTYTSKEVTFLASGWLGCPDQYMSMVRAKMPDYVLRAPREWNATEPRHLDFLRAYNHVAKNNKGYKTISKKAWLEEFRDLSPTTDTFIGEFTPQSEIKNSCVPILKEIKSVMGIVKGKRKKRLKKVNDCITKAYKFIMSNDTLDHGVYPAYGTLKEMY